MTENRETPGVWTKLFYGFGSVAFGVKDNGFAFFLLPYYNQVLGLSEVSVGFAAAAAIVHELMEARDEKRLLRLQRQLAAYKLLIVDELGYVPLSQTGAELLFEVFSQRYETGSTIVTSNLPFDEWTSVFGAERLTGALLDRLTHHVHILEMNGDSYRLTHSKRRSRRPRPDTTTDAATQD